ncbi:hypothetical protein K491DRAFT_697143 [Lophiostoma macrostomum CBS 122681]|uniref:Uncharacterized protein n=1 Tax=Lophiostoma macrostomum CBS 122681 TaxID=1314788 RepID=A0A6A6SVF0_9PLEO|nr:hypothetical protein K491DRAFT_697143 [Lophiostoma macrostomum CBS 122681]
MCWHNLTQHSGCGHIGEAHHEPWTLCPQALERLEANRGPSSPPFIPPQIQPAPPTRLPTTSKTRKLTRTISDAVRSNPKRGAEPRSVSGPNISRSSTSSMPTISSYRDLPDHVLERVKCTGSEINERTQVDASAGGKRMNVCKDCKASIKDMCAMLDMYNKNGSIKGTAAFRKFLQNSVGDVEKDVGDGRFDSGALQGYRYDG